MTPSRIFLASLLALTAILACPRAGRAQPELVWGGDEAGGGPYIYPDSQGNRVGFEVELAADLARRLGRTPRFQQVTWADLPQALANRQIDIVLNGYEYTEARNRNNNCTLPYFIYSLRLIVQADADGRPLHRDWEDVLRPHRDGTLKTVAVLKGTLAQRFLEDRFADRVEVQPTDDVAEMLELLSDGRIDATVQDSPAAEFYVRGGRYPRLRVVGEPLSHGVYVILADAEKPELKARLDEALRAMFGDGTLEAILRRHRLWNVEQQRLSYFYQKRTPITDGELFDEPTGEAPAVPKLSLGGLTRPLIHAAWMTLALAFSSMPLAILLGLALAVARLYGPAPLRWLATLMVEILRGTPLLLQMFFWFFLVPQGLRALSLDGLHELWTGSPFLIGVLGLALNYSASEAENYRAGLQAIPRGQLEAALALGMTRRTAIRRILLPQAIRIVIPPVTNDFIALLKDTSICSMILVTELTGLYHKYKTFPEVAPQLALTVAAIYLFLSYPLALVARRLEGGRS